VPAINPERLLGDLYALRKIGTYKTGVNRPTLSLDDVISRQWLVERMTEAGLDAQIDGIANVFGRSRSRGRIVLARTPLDQDRGTVEACIENGTGRSSSARRRRSSRLR
jgi:beta-ureidopropionase / N-carbamoyl-L-amino-acid hydrolase